MVFHSSESAAACRRARIFIGLLVPLLIGSAAAAQDVASDGSSETLAESEPDVEAAENAEAQDKANEKTREILKVVAYGLLFGGLLLVAILWRFVWVLGRQTVRRARKPPPEQSEIDELWYLHPAKKAASSTGPDEPDDPEAAEDEPGHA